MAKFNTAIRTIIQPVTQVALYIRVYGIIRFLAIQLSSIYLNGLYVFLILQFVFGFVLTDYEGSIIPILAMSVGLIMLVKSMKVNNNINCIIDLGGTLLFLLTLIINWVTIAHIIVIIIWLVQLIVFIPIYIITVIYRDILVQLNYIHTIHKDT